MKTYLLLLCGLPLISAAAPVSHGNAATTASSDNPTATAITYPAAGTHCPAANGTAGAGQCLHAGQAQGACLVASGATPTQAHSAAMVENERVSHDPPAVPGPNARPHPTEAGQLRHGDGTPKTTPHAATAGANTLSHAARIAP